MKKITSSLKKFLPWAAAIAVFVYLFRSHPPGEILKSIRLMNAPLFCVVALLYFALMFLIDTFSISRVLSRFGHPESLRELLPARGATYLLMVVNYAAAQGAFAYYQYRRHGLPISKMLGIFGIVVVVDFYILITLALVTSFFTSWPFSVGDMNIGAFIRIFSAAAYAGFAIFLLLARMSGKRAFMERLRKNKLIDLLATTRCVDYVVVMLSRLPVHIFIMVGMYVAILTFNASVPFLKVLANIPIVFFIGALPITPGGLGTSNAALVALFEPFITGPAIDSGAVKAGDLIFSFSLVWLFVNYMMKALTGFICLKLVSKNLFRPSEEVSVMQ